MRARPAVLVTAVVLALVLVTAPALSKPPADVGGAGDAAAATARGPGPSRGT